MPSAAHLVGGLAEGERLALREQVRHQQVVLPAERIERLGEADEVARHEPRALVDELVERMLAVGARLAPEHRRRLDADRRAVELDVLAVALHRQLLQVGGQALQVLLVGQHGERRRAEEVVVPDREQAEQRRHARSRSARCGSARPSRGSRRASRGSARGRSRSASTGRSPSPSSSGRRPSPRSRTCSRRRCRTSATPFGVGRDRRRSGSPPPSRRRAGRRTSRARRARWSASRAS